MGKSHYIIPVFVPDLGCPHRCVFCNQKKITGSDDVPIGDEVREKIDRYLTTIPKTSQVVIEVAFYGGSFTAVDPKLQKELLLPAYNMLTEQKIDQIRVSTRPDAVNEDVMSLLTAYGVGIVELGVQSMDDEVLSKSFRGHTSRDVLRATAMIKSWGLSLGYQIMIGLPGDSQEKNITTAEELISMKPDIVRIYPCLVLKDTPLAELYYRGGYVPLKLEEAVERCKKLLLLFEREDIGVIRIGLQPSEQINLEGDVLAGPYHPAFRELVESSVARDQLDYIMRKKIYRDNACIVQLAVPPQDISIVRGHHGSNRKYLKEAYGIKEFKTIEDSSLSRGSIKLTCVDGEKVDCLVCRKDII